MHLEVLFSAGILPTMTVGEPGAHGVVVAGMQGIGVNTPIAAAVAEATVGLAMDMHMPNGGMFIIGMWSMMLADGGPAHRVRLAGNTFNVLGAMPNVHIIMAPALTFCAIAL